MTLALSAEPGELRFTVSILRAATGKTETVEMVGYLDPADLPQPIKTEET